jgi:hypothetical protein
MVACAGSWRSVAVAGLLTMVVIGGASGDAVAAERTVLGEYFTATW